MRVMVTDGNERSALAACRALLASAHEVHSVASTPWSLAGVSWGVRPHVVTEDPLARPAAYAEAIGVVAGAVRAHVLLPVTDASVEALLTYRDSLPALVRLPLPDLAQ